MIETDILIAGGGVAGLTAAAALGQAGISVTLVDPAPPVTDAGAPGADLRTTAFLQPARGLLSRAGLWERLSPYAAPLWTMRIVDAGQSETDLVSRDFVSTELSDDPFGWNFPNWLLRREMLARLSELPKVDFRPGTGFGRMVTRTGEALVTLSDGARMRAKLVIGADGRDSAVRTAAGIGAGTTTYGQKAVVFAVGHDAPHDGVSTEVHRRGGPFTLVPLPDDPTDGTHRSAVVWMLPGPEARELMTLSETDFSIAATERSAGVQGELVLKSKRQIWPIITRLADRMSAERTALIAEAAHVVPPIGAQGLNMSLADISTLVDLVTDRPAEIGTQTMLDTYHRKRHPDVRLRATGIDALNRASMNGQPVLQDMRSRGIEVLHDLGPVRQGLMRLGLGLSRSTR